MRRVLLGFVLIVVTGAPVVGQWLRYPTEGVPRKADGTPDLERAHTAAAGRQAGPLRHLARVESQPVRSRHRSVRRVRHRDRRVALNRNLGLDLPGGLPYQPWAAALAKERAADDSRDDPHVRCLPDNPPRAWTLPHLTKAIHTPKLLVLLYEVNAMYRQIFIDGRPLPEDPTPGWNGYSTARWDGDTLVVQTAGFRDNLWIDMGGSPMSDAAKMTERIRRPNYGTLNWRSPSTIPRSTPGHSRSS